MTLKDKWIVITRPAHQVENLTRKLKSANAHPILFPLIEITPPRDLVALKKQWNNLQNFDLVVFVSANAVDQSFKWINSFQLQFVKVATTGKKTAEALKKHGVKIDYCPEQLFNSEALLAMSNFKQFCIGKKIAIIRGGDGRDLLRNELLQIKAEVEYINVYQRECPQKNLNVLEQHAKNNKLDIILLTSGSSVCHFFDLVENHKKSKQWINKLTLLLGSSRMQKKIPDHFQGKILIAEDPSDETLCEELKTIYG